eukprot:6128675-Pyramimonas_sp.AAC.1
MDVPVGQTWHGHEGGEHFEVEWLCCDSGASPRKTKYGTAWVANILSRSCGGHCPKKINVHACAGFPCKAKWSLSQCGDVEPRSFHLRPTTRRPGAAGPPA